MVISDPRLSLRTLFSILGSNHTAFTFLYFIADIGQISTHTHTHMQDQEP